MDPRDTVCISVPVRYPRFFKHYSRKLDAARSLLAFSGTPANDAEAAFAYVRNHPAVWDIQIRAHAAMCMLCKSPVQYATRAEDATHVSIINPRQVPYNVLFGTLQGTRTATIQPDMMPVWPYTHHKFFVASELDTDVLVLYWII